MSPGQREYYEMSCNQAKSASAQLTCNCVLYLNDDPRVNSGINTQDLENWRNRNRNKNRKPCACSTIQHLSPQHNFLVLTPYSMIPLTTENPLILVVSILSDQASAAFLGTEFQRFTSIWVKTFLFISLLKGQSLTLRHKWNKTSLMQDFEYKIYHLPLPLPGEPAY